MSKIIIAGGGLTGLSSALHLLNYEHEIYIIDSRQELGTQIRSPGLIKQINKFSQIKKIMEQEPFTYPNFSNNQAIFRREWLEKTIATELSQKGAKILLKTRIIESKKVRERFEISLKGAGRGAPTKLLCDRIINALGNKTKTAGWTGDPTILHREAISIPMNTKITNWVCAIVSIDNPTKILGDVGWDESEKLWWGVRADNTIECWHQSNNFEKLEELFTFNIIEKREGPHPYDIHLFGADSALEKGETLSKKVIQSLGT